MINIAVAGAKGRMGQEIIKLLQSDTEAKLTATLLSDKKNNLEPKSIDVLIDFSVKDAIKDHLEFCVEHHIPLVIGVTGLTEVEKNAIVHASNSIPILFSPNMSIGVNITFKILQLASELLKNNSINANFKPDVAIHEVHHKGKKDAPSGTALRMQEVLAKSHLTPEIPITSQRLGEVPGEHTAIFALPGEQLEITHKASDRSIFARGAILAAKWLYQKPAGLYDMQDVLK